MEVSQKPKGRAIPYDAAIPLMGIYLKKENRLIQRDTCTPVLTAAGHGGSLSIHQERSEQRRRGAAQWMPLSRGRE